MPFPWLRACCWRNLDCTYGATDLRREVVSVLMGCWALSMLAQSGEKLFVSDKLRSRYVERWTERKAGQEFACAAEASFFLGRFGPFAAMPKGLALPRL